MKKAKCKENIAAFVAGLWLFIDTYAMPYSRN